MSWLLLCNGPEHLATITEYRNVKTFFFTCCLRLKTESHRVQQLVQHYLRSFLGLASSDLQYAACDAKYLSTVLGLVFLSGFFKNPTIPPLLLFADDIKLQPSSLSVAKRMLAVTTTWSVYNGIRINVDKSGVISNHITSSIPFQINDQPLPLVKTYDYLGLLFNANGIDLKAHVANVTRKTE